ncbi:Alpha/Beta hydrolase protein [Rhexocercosporidium sp. MPI-PUGE-AT-0058]|nr:Alpha/Beta hydrolase protein [Rhexocercosporidium sp. MPI-PUGE-AT-0058]
MDAPLPTAAPHLSSTGEPSISAEEQAIIFISQRKFHRLFTLPATNSHDVLKVTYGIAGPDIGEDAPTILYIGGMFGTRYLAVTQDWFATQKGVRILMIDKPGFGGSTPVPVSQRIPIYLEAVVALLTHLKIQHIALASQSAGTIYALNFISHYPDLLCPSNPVLTLFSPWVHQSISGAMSLKLAAALPNPLINGWNSIIGGIVTTGIPTFQASSTVFGNIFRNNDRETTSREGLEKSSRESFGCSLAVYNELTRISSKFLFAENTLGGNDEARLCLKSVPGSNWDRCEVYPTFVLDLKVEWGKRAKQDGKKLRLDIVFGEGEDAMIGAKGMKYFKDCFNKENCGDGIEVEVCETAGAGHDTVIDPCFAPIGRLHDRVRKGWRESR